MGTKEKAILEVIKPHLINGLEEERLRIINAEPDNMDFNDDHWDELFATANKSQHQGRNEINSSNVIKLAFPENKDI